MPAIAPHFSNSMQRIENKQRHKSLFFVLQQNMPILHRHSCCSLSLHKKGFYFQHSFPDVGTWQQHGSCPQLRLVFHFYPLKTLLLPLPSQQALPLCRVLLVGATVLGTPTTQAQCLAPESVPGDAPVAHATLACTEYSWPTSIQRQMAAVKVTATLPAAEELCSRHQIHAGRAPQRRRKRAGMDRF